MQTLQQRAPMRDIGHRSLVEHGPAQETVTPVLPPGLVSQVPPGFGASPNMARMEHQRWESRALLAEQRGRLADSSDRRNTAWVV
jgi:hypothetical protein